MEPIRCYLITLTNGRGIIRVALKAKRPVEYFMESDGREELEDQLPPYVRGYGNIVHVEELFEVTVQPQEGT